MGGQSTAPTALQCSERKPRACTVLQDEYEKHAQQAALGRHFYRPVLASSELTHKHIHPHMCSKRKPRACAVLQDKYKKRTQQAAHERIMSRYTHWYVRV